MKFHRKYIVIPGLLGLTLVQGCAQMPLFLKNNADQPLECGPNASASGELAVRTSTIEKLMGDDRPRAALSHIAALENEMQRTQTSQLWRAQALRKIGHLDVARVIFSDLRDGCVAAEANRGLGLVEGEKGNWVEAERALREAHRLDPISPRIHNDLGYAQLKIGQLGRAIEHFQAALELDPNRSRSANNLVLALLLADKEVKARELSARLGLSDDHWTALIDQAGGWRVTQRPNASPDPEATVAPDLEEKREEYKGDATSSDTNEAETNLRGTNP